MRIVLIGQGPFGEKVLEALLKGGEEVVGSFSPPDKKGEGIKVLAEKFGIPFFRPSLMKDPQVYDAYAKLRPDLAMLAFVTDIIPEELLAIPPWGPSVIILLFCPDIAVPVRLIGLLFRAIPTRG